MSCNGSGSSHGGNGQQAAGRDEQQLPGNQLTRSGVVRMMRRVLAAEVRVSGPAKNFAKGCAEEFINAVADEAAKCSNQHGRSMLTPEDVTRALRTLGFERYLELLETYLHRYREAASGADEELLQILTQVMSEAGGNNSS